MTKVRFTVTGANQDELEEKAAKTLLAFVSADHKFRIEYDMDVTTLAETYQGDITLWRANVEAELP